MKVIAKKDHSTYICEVNHIELEKYFNLYYAKEDLKKLSVDQEIDLAKGHSFFRDTQSALEKTREFFKSHESTVKAIANGFLLVASESENTDKS